PNLENEGNIRTAFSARSSAFQRRPEMQTTLDEIDVKATASRFSDLFDRRRSRQPMQRKRLYRYDAVRRRGRIRHRRLQRKVRIRFADAREISFGLASGRLDRSPVSALYDGQSSGAQAVARVLVLA